MIRISEECVSERLIQELHPLLVAHYHEIADNQDKIKLNPDYQWYFNQDRAGALHVVVAREEGRAVGYFVSVVATNPHYKDHRFAVNDILYVDPRFRGTTLPIRLFNYAEEKLRRKGVSVITLHMKVDHPFEGFAEKMGYSKREYNYTKWIGE